MLGGNPAFIPSNYESIASSTLSGGETSVTFSSIPSTYKHLQIRWNALNSSANADIAFRLNSDTGNNYTFHGVEANGTTISGSNKGTSLSEAYVGIGSGVSSVPGVGVLDLLDYTSTNKYKTIKSFFGYDSNGSGYTIFRSSLWLDTSAVNTISVRVTPGTFSQYTSFALYGVK
jgi:hypothetical protein